MTCNYAQLAFTYQKQSICKSDAHTESDVKALKQVFELITKQTEPYKLLLSHILVPLRTTTWGDLATDCFYPLSTHYLKFSIKEVSPLLKKIITVAFMIFDLITSPIRSLTLVPYMLYQKHVVGEHELFYYLKTRGIILDRLKYPYIRVCFFEPTDLYIEGDVDTATLNGKNHRSKLDLTYLRPLASSVTNRSRLDLDIPINPSKKDIGLDQTIS